MPDCIMVLTSDSSDSHIHRTQQWENSLKKLAETYDIYYLVAKNKCPLHHNVHSLVTPYDDDYENIPMKVWYGIQYLRYFYTGILIIDDNILINNIPEFTRIWDYERAQYGYIAFNRVAVLQSDVASFYHVGKTRHTYTYNMPCVLKRCAYAGGGAYYIRSDIADLININDMQYELYEDYAIGYALHRRGVKVHASNISRGIISGAHTPDDNARARIMIPINADILDIKQIARPIYTCYVYIQGGLGNQLFQLAAAVAYCIDHNMTLKIITGQSRQSYWDTCLSKWSKYIDNKVNQPLSCYNETAFCYRAIPYFESDILISGYFQSDKYTKIINSRTLLDINWPADRTSNYVAVHARRGDYKSLTEIHPLQDIAYYTAAMQYIKSRLPNAVFLLFSDEPEFWTAHAECLKEYEIEIVIESNTIDSLAMMASCSNLIIANSSFSWWAAKLRKSTDGIVIAPVNWFGPKGPQDTQDLIPKDWVLM